MPDKSKRPYVKQSPYWSKRATPVAPTESKQEAFPNIELTSDGLEPFSAVAACGGGSSGVSRDGFSGSIIPVDAYRNIDSGLLPWEVSNGHISITRAIILVQKAYANVAIVRNTIESAVEFSNATLHVISPNETVNTFFYEWLNRINIYKLAEQFFREYYRSGNVFMYKFVGKLTPDQYGKMQAAFSAKSDILPVRYIILNPSQVYLQGGIGYNSSNWTKILSTFEIEALLAGKTTEDKQIFNSLPQVTKDLLTKSRGGYTSIYMPLDPKRLSYTFYKKQDYEPLALPMIFPVLNDIEFKLELKKMDMSLARTMEQVILLVTNGQKNDEWNKAGMNGNNLAALQAIFRSQTIGRVLVADFTTSAKWLIPDIGNIIGPQKYEQVEADIKEGLQSILGGVDEKFANAQIKAKVFIERMKDGQKAFLSFLLAEAKTVCQAMGFRNMPRFEFQEISLEDPTNLQRIYTTLAQLGVLTADETVEAIKTGVLPDKESAVLNQVVYKKARDKGLYMPLIGGPQDTTQPEGRPSGVKAPQTTKKQSPIGTSTSSASLSTPTGDNDIMFSQSKLVDLLPRANQLKEQVKAALCKRYKVDEASLDAAQLIAIQALTRSIVVNEEPANWTEGTIKTYATSPKDISVEAGRQMDQIQIEHDLDSWTAAIMIRCIKDDAV